MSPGDGRGSARHHSDEATRTAQTSTRQDAQPAVDGTASPSTVDLLAHAVAYARDGWEVLPLVPGGKLPHRLAPHAKDSATSDVDQVRDWWVQAPTANIGLRPPADVVVVDVDPRDGGALNLVELKAGRPLVPTWTCWTGGGGLHAYYRAPGPYRKKLCAGVDLKHRTGYVVAPPSLHASGRRYVWGNGLPIADAPAWLVEAMRPLPVSLHRPVLGSPFAPSASDDGLVRLVAAAPAGERNHLLFWAGCRAAERGQLGALAARLLAAARTAGLGDAEARATLGSAWTRVAA